MTTICEEHIVGSTRYIVAGCSVKGQGKESNQDSFGVLCDERGLSICVADGLGSAPMSSIGSKTAVDSMLRGIRLEENHSQLFLSVHQMWKETFTGNEIDYDTTCKFVHIGSNQMIYGGVGDGWIGIDNGKEIADIRVDHVFSNQTESMCSFDLRGSFKILVGDPENMTSCIIATDGFSEDLTDGTAHEFLSEATTSILKNRVDFVSNLESLMMDWPVKTNCDDKTAIFIVRVPDENQIQP